MKNFFNIKTILCALVLGAGAILTGCEDDENLPKADALFRPVVAEGNIIAGGQWIELKWDRYTGASSFELALTGKDGLELTATTDTTFYRFEGLAYDTDYTIKIRSLSKTDGLMSQYYVLPVITTTDIATNLKDVQAIDNMALFAWDNDSYKSLKLFQVYTPEGATEAVEELVKDTLFEAKDLAAQQIILKNLEPKNSYVARIYNAEGKYSGKKKFSTTAPEQYTGAVIDLRSYDEEESYKLFTQAFIDQAVKDYPDQDITIVLQGGITYELATVLLPATTGTVKVATGLSLNGMANFAVSGNLGVKAGMAVGGFTVEKVFFTDHPSKPKTSGNYGGCYLFNFNNSGSSVGKLSLINSMIKYKRGVCRIQTKASIQEFVMDNCILDSIGGYGVTNADNGDATIKNIKVTKSTFSHCDKLFVSSKPSADKEITSLTVENCTFVYNMTNGNNFLFDFNKMTFINNPTLKNCIFGPAGSKGEAAVCSGFRAAKGSLTIDKCYGTSDVAWFSEDGMTPVAPIDLTLLKTDVKATFANASLSNFKVTDGDIVNLIGDPRWW